MPVLREHPQPMRSRSRRQIEDGKEDQVLALVEIRIPPIRAAVELLGKGRYLARCARRAEAREVQIEEIADQGHYELTRENADRGAFKTPTLRDVAVSGPYMHDGKLKTLKDVVDFYAGKGNSNPYLDKRIKDIQLTGQDRSDLVEFMKSLTGTLPPNVGPPGKD